MSVLLETNLGNIVIDLYYERCSNECFNFIKLCKSKYYYYSPFINVQKDFICQCGNPQYPQKPKFSNIYDILSKDNCVYSNSCSNSKLKNNQVGLISLIREGPQGFSSEFIITLTNDPKRLESLENRTSVFGSIAEGYGTINKINKSLLDEHNRPLKDIRILHTYVLVDPFPDPIDVNFRIPQQEPLPTKEQIDSFQFMLDEESDATSEDQYQLKSDAQALTLEILHQIPSARIKPSEKVLFICKLNPITEESDLQHIFSRFGDVISVDIIRDRGTGASLCYGFIQFGDAESVERAYLKMDGAAIDGRVIHVDFSQSIKRTRQYRR